MPPQTSLDNVFLSQCSSSTVQLISGLTSLTYCEIQSPEDTIDLTSLKALVKLQKLHLTDGYFYAAGLPAHLTNLTVNAADMLIPHSPLGCSCVTSVRKLRVKDGELVGLHPCGLLACSAVDHLQIVRCSIPPDEPEQCVSLAHESAISTCLPPGVSALTLLSSLTVTLGNLDSTLLDTDLVDLGPLHALPLLQDLSVRSESLGVDLRLSAELGALQNLTCLTLSAPEHDEDDQSDCPTVSLDVEWGNLHALQHLGVYNWRFSCTSSILALTTLRHLSVVSFDNNRPADEADEESSFKCFSFLIHQLGRYCPHVELFIDSEAAVWSDN